MSLKLSKTRWVEAGILAPSAFVFVQALPFGVFYTGFVLAVGAFVRPEWQPTRPILLLFLMMVAAAGGLASLWLSVLFGPEWVHARHRRRRGILAGLAAGLAAALYWVSLQDYPPQTAGQRNALLVWAALLIAPVAISLKYLCLFCFARRTK